MSARQAERKKRSSLPELPAQVTEEGVKKQLSLAAGTERFQYRDPIYHLTESFRHTFDLMGQQRARGDQPDLGSMLSVYMGEETPGLDGMESAQEGPQTGDGAGLSPEFLHKTSMNSAYQPRDWGADHRLMDKFADVTFQRGNLSAAILRGTGKMMLFSCLQRTVGQQETKQLRERMLFQAHSSHRHIPGRREDISVVNKGFTDSAVGLVVDVLKDSRQVLDSLTALAEGKGLDGENGVGTLRKQYPFLTDEAERGLLEEYRARLEGLKGPGHEAEREVLQRAQEKAQAIMQKKAQMKRDFLQKLRHLSHCAVSAQEAFSQEDFLWEAARRLETAETETPPGDGDGGDGRDAGEDPEL